MLMMVYFESVAGVAVKGLYCPRVLMRPVGH